MDDQNAPGGTLRGAGVEVDRRRVGLVIWLTSVASLVILSAVFLFVGAAKNTEISTLQHDGRPVVVTVTTCQGLLGGSGSNAAGYACQGTYVVDGTRYYQAIPGNEQHAIGSRIAAVVGQSDPRLLSTPSILATEHTSLGVYVVPVLLLLAAVGLTVGGVLLLRRRAVG